MTVRVAAIDCGTNSIRLLVADLDPIGGGAADGAPENAAGGVAEKELERRMEIVRLGQGVDATGRIADEALVRTFAACDRYAAVIEEYGAERIRFVATSAMRDAANRDEFTAGVLQRFGVEPEIITGAQEAELSFTGATRAIAEEAAKAGADAYPTPYLVVDIGGGSTEFVLGTDRVEASRSVDIGCVRLTERYLKSDPPTPAQIDAVRRDVDEAIDLVAQTVPLDRAATLVGVAGSVTTVTAISLGLSEYDRRRVHLSRVPAETVHRVAVDLLAASREQRAANPVIHPGRVDVIGAGALVLDRIMDRLGLPCVIASEHDILDGIALSLA